MYLYCTLSKKKAILLRRKLSNKADDHDAKSH